MTTSHKKSVVLLCGLSGAGKSVAVRALEDIGYYCIDHLPAEVLTPTLEVLQQQKINRIAVGLELNDPVFVKNAQLHWEHLKSMGFELTLIVLTCRPEVLLRRYFETRRPHPLIKDGLSTENAIALETRYLRDLPRGSHVVDTSDMKAVELTKWIQQYVQPESTGLTLVLQSFGFKYGVAQDADMVFDARCLPNPHYEPKLRPLTGRDPEVQNYFAQHDVVSKFTQSIEMFLNQWCDLYEADHRTCLTVAIGCTGGQHRSVFIVETLAQKCHPRMALVRHREERTWPIKK